MTKERQAEKQSEKLELLQGTLDMMVLSTLGIGPANGYELAKTIERMSNEVLQVDHGSLYPALRRLEKQKLLTAKWETSASNRRAKYYRLTPLGRKQLLTEQSNWTRIVEAISRVMSPA